MKVITQIGLYLFSMFQFIYSITNKQVLETVPFQHQKSPFQMQYAPPTNATEFATAAYTFPLLSHILFELNPLKELRKDQFIKDIKFSGYRLTRGEAEIIFTFADKDRNDLLSQEEWDLFTQYYILPYEACDTNKDYLLDSKEFSVCFQKNPDSNFIIFRRRDDPSKYEQIMWTVTTRANALINFHDYLLIRRATYGWRSCQSSSKYIAKDNFKCAAHLSLGQSVYFNLNFDDIYNVGLMLANEKGLIELDFLGYLRALHSLYVFSIYGAPMSEPFIEKQAFIKAIKEDRLPINFQESEVNTLYEITNTNVFKPFQQSYHMNFHSFAFFHGLKRLFNRYSIERPNLLMRHEFIKLLDDKLCPYKTLLSVDQSITNFNTTMYLEASLVINRKRPSENEFFYSFKQDASQNTASIWNDTTILNTYYVQLKNDTNRNRFFSIFSDNESKDVMTEFNYYRAFQLSNLYTSIIPETFVVSATSFNDKLLNLYNMVNPPISIAQRSNYRFYKDLPRDINIDILIFLSIENFTTKFISFLRTSKKLIPEAPLKMILQDFGMINMPDPVLDLGKKGYDNLRRRVYDIMETFKNLIVTQAVAAENERSRQMVNKYKIPANIEESRRFPNYPRRNEVSDYA